MSNAKKVGGLAGLGCLTLILASCGVGCAAIVAGSGDTTTTTTVSKAATTTTQTPTTVATTVAPSTVPVTAPPATPAPVRLTAKQGSKDACETFYALLHSDLKPGTIIVGVTSMKEQSQDGTADVKKAATKMSDSVTQGKEFSSDEFTAMGYDMLFACVAAGYEFS